jgi:hypothetical protein
MFSLWFLTHPAALPQAFAMAAIGMTLLLKLVWCAR